MAAASVRVASTAGAFRNQVAITGTIVNETNSDATKARAKVSANGLNNCPTRPPTPAIGRKTATVVKVAAVIAPATSLTEFKIASSFFSP